MTDAHRRDASEVADLLGAAPATGLTTADAEQRADAWGANKLAEPARRPQWLRLLDQFRSWLIGSAPGRIGVESERFPLTASDRLCDPSLQVTAGPIPETRRSERCVRNTRRTARLVCRSVFSQVRAYFPKLVNPSGSNPGRIRAVSIVVPVHYPCRILGYSGCHMWSSVVVQRTSRNLMHAAVHVRGVFLPTCELPRVP
ncbi:cation-transporting P-type ATPase [Streptomyces sp. NPDC006967]|uniref:cation-transporting P-type ATPase n=1 Tax=Streptomyces sp. NPDC006967 TaxID=3156906 RepID=UPI00340289FF